MTMMKKSHDNDEGEYGDVIVWCMDVNVHEMK